MCWAPLFHPQLTPTQSCFACDPLHLFQQLCLLLLVCGGCFVGVWKKWVVWCSHQGTRVCLPSSPIPTCHLHPPCHPLSLPSGQDPATPTPTPYTHQLYSASVLLCHSSAVHHNCCCCCCCCCCCSTSQSAKMGHPSLHTLLPQLCIAVMAALSVCGRLLGASPFQPFPTTGLPGRGGGGKHSAPPPPLRVPGRAPSAVATYY